RPASARRDVVRHEGAALAPCSGRGGRVASASAVVDTARRAVEASDLWAGVVPRLLTGAVAVAVADVEPRRAATGHAWSTRAQGR
ncbi:MAG TPA: hypothetical protein VF606_05365, partial [Geminicoccaceae bacterium]